MGSGGGGGGGERDFTTCSQNITLNLQRDVAKCIKPCGERRNSAAKFQASSQLWSSITINNTVARPPSSPPFACIQSMHCLSTLASFALLGTGALLSQSDRDALHSPRVRLMRGNCSQLRFSYLTPHHKAQGVNQRE